jgi:hypothetical protein
MFIYLIYPIIKQVSFKTVFEALQSLTLQTGIKVASAKPNSATFPSHYLNNIFILSKNAHIILCYTCWEISRIKSEP